MPKDSKGSTGSSYILDKKNKKVLIPIDVNKIGDINKLFGTLTEEVSHGKDALEGRHNNSKIKLSTDGIDLTNANVGEKVGDVITPEDREERAKLHKENKEFQKILNKGSGGLQQLISRRNEEIKKALEYLNDPERREQIKNGIIDGLIGVGIATAGIIVTAAAVSSGPGGWVAIGSVLIPAETAAVGGVATAVVGTARADYGNKKIANALTDDELKEPKHLIADTIFKNYKDEYYLGEAMLGAGMLNIAPHTFPIGTVENNIPLQQGALPYYSNTYTNLPAVTNVGNTSLVSYNNQNHLFAPVATNVMPAITSLTVIDGANKVSQVQNNFFSYNSRLALPIKYPIVTKRGVKIYQDYAIGIRGGEYKEAGITKDNKIAYRNNGSYYVIGEGSDGFKNISATDVTTNYLVSASGGRKGNPKTRGEIDAIIDEATNMKWIHVAGGDKSEEYLSASKLGNKSTKDSNYIDITLQKVIEGKKVTVRINTVDIYKNGNLTKREAEAARLINLKIIGEGKGNPQLITIPKGQGTGNIEKILKKIEADIEKDTK